MRRGWLAVLSLWALPVRGLMKQQYRSSDSKQARDVLRVLDMPIWNMDWYGPTWLVNITIGSPGQPIAAMIDPYSADTGVVSSDTIGGLPTYNPNSSSTFNGYTSTVFNSSWGLGSYAQDTFYLGVEAVGNVQFVELSENSPWHDDSFLGLGLPGTEDAYSTNGLSIYYPTILDDLVSQGTIQTSSYSIWMDSDSGDTGHLLLGGIDTRKYTPPLVSTLNRGLVASLVSVGINQVTESNPNVTIGAVQEVKLDLGFFTTLPGHITSQIWDALGAQYNTRVDPTDTIPIVPCSYKSNASVVTFHFSGDVPNNEIWVDVPLRELVIQNGSGPNYDQGPYASACTLAINCTSSSFPSAIGTSVMKYLYTVFDISQNQVSLAPVKFNTTSGSVFAIPSGGVQSLSAVTGQSGSTTGSSGNGDVSSTSDNGGGGGFLGLPGGLGVGFGALFALICIKVVLIMWWKGRKHAIASRDRQVRRETLVELQRLNSLASPTGK